MRNIHRRQQLSFVLPTFAAGRTNESCVKSLDPHRRIEYHKASRFVEVDMRRLSALMLALALIGAACLASVTRAPLLASSGDTAAERFLWPVPASSMITGCYGLDGSRQHTGIDISAPQGTPVVALAAGVVTKVYTECSHNYSKTTRCCDSGYGNYVQITHTATIDGKSVVSLYHHFTSVSVSAGQRITAGQTLGTIGCTGISTGNHLDLKLLIGGDYADPGYYLRLPGDLVAAGTTASTCCGKYVTRIKAVYAGEPSSAAPAVIPPPAAAAPATTTAPTATQKATSAAATTAPKSLSMGSSGNAVKQLQLQLNKLGYGLTADGSFGNKTRMAVVDFQTRRDLVTDGVAGPTTQHALTTLLAQSPKGLYCIRITKLPTTQNRVGQTISFEGLIVTAYYSDGTTAAVTPERVTLDDPVPGANAVVVDYHEQQEVFTMTLLAAAPMPSEEPAESPSPTPDLSPEPTNAASESPLPPSPTAPEPSPTPTPTPERTPSPPTPQTPAPHPPTPPPPEHIGLGRWTGLLTGLGLLLIVASALLIFLSLRHTKTINLTEVLDEPPPPTDAPAEPPPPPENDLPRLTQV